MNPRELGKQLLALCKSAKSKSAKIKGLLESLTEDQRRKVVKYKNEVSESRGAVYSCTVIQSKCYISTDVCMGKVSVWLQKGMTPLYWAAWNNSVDVSELLIRSGANVKAKSNVSAAFTSIASAWLVPSFNDDCPMTFYDHQLMSLRLVQNLL